MATGTIVLTRGDSFAQSLAVDQDSGLDYGLEGATVWFTVKERAADLDVDALIQHRTGVGTSLVVTDAPTGAISHTISHAETAALEPGVYRYDYQLVAADGSVATLEAGKVVVRQDVTRSIA